jgi:hypothetical protein
MLTAILPQLMKTTAFNRKTSFFFVLYIAIVLPLCFLGYGSDNDSYGVLDAARSTWRDGHLVTSRNPGYWLYEALVYAINNVGGSLATNIASMCAGAFILWRFIALCRKIGVRNEYLLASCVLFVPTFLIAASSTIDYLWSIALLILAVELLLDTNLVLASIAGAVAIGFRTSNSLVLAGAYAGILLYGLRSTWKLPEMVRIAASGIAAAILGILFLIPSWIIAHHTMAFLTPGIGPAQMWTLKMHAGRFIYKMIYLFGPIATGTILFLLIWNCRQLNRFEKNSIAGKGFAISVGAFLGNILLFAKFPVEVSYLLPGLVFFMLAAGISFLNGSRMGTVAILCGVIVFNLFSISFAKPNIPMHATNARLSISLQRGILIEDIQIRMKVKMCESNTCWSQKAGAQPAI